MKVNESHENYAREEDVERPPDRQFGLVFAVVFTVIGAWPLIHGRPARWWSVTLAGAFLIVALTAPQRLAWLNRIWLRIGLLLHRAVSPVVLGLIFFSTVTPIGLLLRAVGKDPLRLRFDRDASTYWLERQPPGPAAETMSNQF